MMNYCDKIQYRIYKSHGESFEQNLKRLLNEISPDKEVFRIILFSSTADNNQYSEELLLAQRMIGNKFGEKYPAFSYVAQSPLDADMTMEIHYFMPDEDDKIEYKKFEERSYVILENKDGRFMYSGGWQGNLYNDLYTQSKEVFRHIEQLLNKEGFPINSIIRQWNYVEQITAVEEKGQHYQMLNNARSEFYAKANWDNGYPAATGIGSSFGGVLVDFDAAVFKNEMCHATPIDNKLQVAAHAYSDDVLINAGEQKTTPKFERAKSMTFGDRDIVYISGTAAIRGEESLTGVGIKKQLIITLENIDQLIGKSKIRLLRVYLKNKEDYSIVKDFLSAYENKMDISYLLTDVCRDELLIEIEGIAIN